MPALATVKLSSILVNSPLVIKTADANIGVNTTFDPQGTDANGVSTWMDRSGGIVVGYPRMTMQVRNPAKGGTVYKVTVKIFKPTLEQTSPSTATGIQPAPTKAYDCTATLEFLLPQRSTQADRQAIYSLVQSLFASTINASDDNPTDATGSPLYQAVANLNAVY
jgi:hypothetical protein